jgi:hypothetical protein
MIALVAIVALAFAFLRTLFAFELVARLNIGNRRVASIYAEPAFHYEPPGFIFCEILDQDALILSRRRFLSIGPERVPKGRFVALTSPDGELVAITIGRDVVFLYDFRSQRAWPGPYSETDAANYAFARDALRQLGPYHPGLHCQGLADYELYQKRRVRSPPSPPP